MTLKHSGSSYIWSLSSGLLGLTLLLPASLFIMVLLERICFGPSRLYYSMVPSFIQSPFEPSAPHIHPAAQLIFLSLLLAIILNVLSILDFQVQKGAHGRQFSISCKRNWLNIAIALQGGLLFGALLVYTLIQHVRY